MEEFFYVAMNWLYTNYPMIFFSFGLLAGVLYIIKQIKEIFIDKGMEGESFGTKLKYTFCFWLKRPKKKKDENVEEEIANVIEEPKNKIYTVAERRKKIDELKRNNLFEGINNINSSVIPSMNFGNQKKNEILRDIIKIYVEGLKDSILHVLNNYHLDEMDTFEMNNLFADTIDKTSDRIFFKMRNRLGEELYNLLIEHPEKGFKVRNEILREVLVRSILELSTQRMSSFQYDNYNRALAILVMCYISLDRIVKNFEKVFKDFNGELDKYL